MLLVLYDIKCDKLRTKFAKFLTKYGRRIQYSVFEIRNSERMIENMKIEMQSFYEKKFTQADSVLGFHIPDKANILRFGSPKNEETDLLII